MKAVSGDTQSDYAVSSSLLSGAPYNLPVEESWKNGNQKYFWASNAIVGENYFQWFTQISSDNDGGCAYFGSTEAKVGDRAVLSSGKISLAGSSNPKLYFDYYLISNGAHKINVNVKTAHGAKETYDWDDMLLSYGSSTDASVGTISGTAQQQHAVAQLMRDLGVAVDMNYGESASGTNHGSAATGLQNYFGLKDAKNWTEKLTRNPRGWTSSISS